jgi:hypothetical protein
LPGQVVGEDESNRRTTAITRNRFCVGRPFIFDGVQVVRLLDENAVEFYGVDGELLARVDIGERAGRKAA